MARFGVLCAAFFGILVDFDYYPKSAIFELDWVGWMVKGGVVGMQGSGCAG